MQLSKKRGNRIRASDKSLVFRFSAGSLFMLFFMAMLLLNLKAIITTDWNSVTLFSDGSIQFHLTPYRIVTLIILLSCKLDAPAPCRLDAPDFSFVCHVLADCLHQHQQVI